MRRLYVLFVLGFMFCLLQAVVPVTAYAQGSLVPPGPPAPTMKTLDQIEPRKPIKAADLPLTITQPGSYYLTETVKFTKTNTDAIVISSDNVTIDLNGFSLIGPWTAGAEKGSAIATNPKVLVKFLRINHGTVTGWGGTGLNLNPNPQTFPLNVPGTCQQFIISEVISSNNGGGGIAATTNGLIDRCNTSYNAGTGIEAQFWCAVTNCQVIYNGGDGIAVDLGCRVATNNCVNNGRESTSVVAGIHARGGQGGNCNQLLNNFLGGNLNGIYVQSYQGNLVMGNYAYYNMNENFHFISTDGFVGPIITQGNVVASNAPNANFSYH